MAFCVINVLCTSNTYINTYIVLFENGPVLWLICFQVCEVIHAYINKRLYLETKCAYKHQKIETMLKQKVKAIRKQEIKIEHKQSCM